MPLPVRPAAFDSGTTIHRKKTTALDDPKTPGQRNPKAGLEPNSVYVGQTPIAGLPSFKHTFMVISDELGQGVAIRGQGPKDIRLKESIEVATGKKTAAQEPFAPGAGDPSKVGTPDGPPAGMQLINARDKFKPNAADDAKAKAELQKGLKSSPKDIVSASGHPWLAALGIGTSKAAKQVTGAEAMLNKALSPAQQADQFGGQSIHDVASLLVYEAALSKSGKAHTMPSVWGRIEVLEERWNSGATDWNGSTLKKVGSNLADTGKVTKQVITAAGAVAGMGLWYHPFGPNSNTVAHKLFNAARSANAAISMPSISESSTPGWAYPV
jgi:hypothetical protein